MAKPLGELIIEVLTEGGPRKPNILRSLAEHHGQGAQFDAVVAQLKRSKRIKMNYRNGGPHYRLNPRAGPVDPHAGLPSRARECINARTEGHPAKR